MNKSMYNIKGKRPSWSFMYDLAKVYYSHYGNLEIKKSYKTKNGYEEDEDGYNLGTWISTQRQVYNGHGGWAMTDEKIKLLKEIGMRFETRNNDEEWTKMYNLAKVYYNHYGNLEIKTSYKTKNGYEEDEDGYNLGTWISTQRQVYNGHGGWAMTDEKIKLLKEIGMRFKTRNNDEEWTKMYNLAKVYYNHYGNLEIKTSYKTKNGYEEDKDGYNLGTWIYTQKQAYNGHGGWAMTDEKIKLLKEIGMRFETRNNDEEWTKMYNLAKVYYSHYGNLEIKTSYKTKNGYEEDEDGYNLGTWISNQRQAYKGRGRSIITEEKIKSLEEIGMKWFNITVNNKLVQEEIDNRNKIRKQKELLNRLYSLLIKQNEKFNSREEVEKINKEFIKQLSNH